MRKAFDIRVMITLASFAFLFAGCVKESLLGDIDEGSPIVFGADTIWDNLEMTRTEYSGKDESNAMISAGSATERIDWVATKDRIRIFCKEAQGGPTSDYTINDDVQAAAQKSQASMTSTNKNGLRWGTGEHNFFAFYPAPGTVSNYDANVKVKESDIAIAESTEEKKVTFTATIPATQTYVGTKTTTTGGVTVREYKPNMNYAYMFASKRVTRPANSLSLSFKPLMTTFELTLMGLEANTGCKLKSVELSSSSTDMSGKFTALVSNNNTFTLQSTESTGKTLKMVFNDKPALSSTQAVKLTLFALPIAQKNLTLTMYIENSSGTEFKRILEFKVKNATGSYSWLSLAATKKLYLTNVGFPNSLYYITASTPNTTLSYTGAFGTFTVKSYKNDRGVARPVPWTAEFSTDGGMSWQTGLPDMIFEIPTSDATGSTTDKSYEFEARPNLGTHSKKWQGSTTVGTNNSEANARDLSLRDVYGNTINRSTANCYVVPSPGWYKIPCVYGNAIKNGNTNAIAYTNSNSDGHALKRFVNHKNAGITGPWIKNNSVTLKRADLLWEDSWHLVQNVKYSSDFVYFYVAPETIFQGNAVVAVYDDAGSIAWSWHIWVNDHASRDMATVDLYSYTEGTLKSVEYPSKLMKVNVGWCDPDNISGAAARSVKIRFKQTEAGGQTAEITVKQGKSDPVPSKGYSPYYQWGRKDPMLPCYGVDLSSKEHLQWGEKKDTDHLWKKETNPANRPNLAGGIKTPNVFYSSYQAETAAINVAQNVNNWTTQRYDNLWDAGGKDFTDHKVQKTIYDPCPFGFKVPNLNAFTGFTTTGKSSGEGATNPEAAARMRYVKYDYGYYYKINWTDNATAYFPAVGLRNFLNGNIGGLVGEKGDYWLASTRTSLAEGDSGNHKVYEVDLLSGWVDGGQTSRYINPHNTTGARGWGFPVKAIADN